MYFEFILCKGIISFNTFLSWGFLEKGNIADISMVKKVIIDQLILGKVEFSALFALFRRNQASRFADVFKLSILDILTGFFLPLLFWRKKQKTIDLVVA